MDYLSISSKSHILSKAEASRRVLEMSSAASRAMQKNARCPLYIDCLPGMEGNLSPGTIVQGFDPTFRKLCRHLCVSCLRLPTTT